MKINDIYAFGRFYQNFKDTKMPMQLAYRLNKIDKWASEEVKFHEEKLSNILSEYGVMEDGEYKRNKDGNIVIKESKIKECEQILTELFELDHGECDIKIPLDLLDGIGMISPEDLDGLTSFVE